MNCDNCGRTCNSTISEEFTVWKTQLDWPPIYREIRQEMWCNACKYSKNPSSSRVKWELRRKLEFEDEHPHSD